MATTSHTNTDRVVEAKRRYVSAGISDPTLVVSRAEGAWIEDVDGRRYLDFAGGIGCQNTGHRLPAVVEAVREQLDRYLHQCAMVGLYEPYVETCRLLAETSPCRGDEQRSVLLNSGAEAVENAVKIARYATGRQAVVVFEHAFHGRTLLTMTMTSKVVPYKKGFGPFAPEVYRATGPYPYRGVGADEAIHGLESLFKSDVDPGSVACVVLETVQGEGGFIVPPVEYLQRLRELCDQHGIVFVADEVQSGAGRTGPVWAIEHFGVQPDLMTSGKSLGGGLPLAGVTGDARLMDAIHVSGLGGTFGGNPLSCAAAVAVLEEVSSPAYRAKADALGARMRARLEDMATRIDAIGEVRGLGPMLAIELVEDRASKRPAGELAKRATALALDEGLLLLSCGIYGNVIRILVPVVVSDEDVDHGLDVLERSLVAARG